MIFQKPMTRLNPLIRSIRYAKRSRRASATFSRGSQMKKRSLEALGGMGIPPRVSAGAHTFSSGMRQRIMIWWLALVFVCKLVICDEPTTALDVLVEARVAGSSRL